MILLTIRSVRLFGKLGAVVTSMCPHLLTNACHPIVPRFKRVFQPNFVGAIVGKNKSHLISVGVSQKCMQVKGMPNTSN